MTGAERAIRWSTVAAVTAVAIVAGWASYEHAYTVVAAHGEHGAVARIYPGTIDGLIYAASMVLLDSARRSVAAPAIARWLLAAGIVATLAANITAGLAYGWVGCVVAAWPAPALVGSYELLMWLVRTGAASQREIAKAIGDFVAVPANVVEAAEVSMRATHAAGNPLSANQLQERFSLTRAQATKLRSAVLSQSNGHAPIDTDSTEGAER
jgi:hypothetical protein